jgi:hypothetical protein
MVENWGGSESKLVKYWTAGEGAAKIRWGEDGDFNRCVRLVNEAIVKGGGKPMADHMIKGFCANLHRAATGASPGHAAGESKPGH